MKKITKLLSSVVLLIFLSNCQEVSTSKSSIKNGSAKSQVSESRPKTKDAMNYGGFESRVKWGEHLVTITDCNACHTPKIMTDRGPVLDTLRLLSGHPSQMPLIDVDRKEMEKKGLVVTLDLTEWVGPWGISFGANLTPDETGLGNWTEEQFFLALRKGKSKGLSGSRDLLPPMPWQIYGQMTDEEIKAVFAYLKSIKPVRNFVPAPVLPTGVEK